MGVTGMVQEEQIFWKWAIVRGMDVNKRNAAENRSLEKRGIAAVRNLAGCIKKFALLVLRLKVKIHLFLGSGVFKYCLEFCI